MQLQRIAVSSADRVIFAHRFSTPGDQRQEHGGARDRECGAAHRNGEEERRGGNRDEERRKARPWEMDPRWWLRRWERRHADLSAAGTAIAEEDPAVEGGNECEDADRNQLDQCTPVGCDERSNKGDHPLKERAECIHALRLSRLRSSWRGAR